MIWMICEQKNALGQLQSKYAEVGQCVGYSKLRMVIEMKVLLDRSIETLKFLRHATAC